MNIFFALLTDFGYDFAVATMESLILKQLPQARVIHLDHTITKFNVVSGAFVLQQVYDYCPKNTIILGIVDPGVGSERRAICIEYDGYTFIGPNNGLFHYILKREGRRVYSIDEHIIKPASYTFHGRDLFTPAAIKIANNQKDFLKPIAEDEIVYLHAIENRSIVTYIDSFGNIKTNIKLDNLNQQVHHLVLEIQGVRYHTQFVKTFADVPVGQLLSYEGSNKTLELAVNLGSAQSLLHAQPGQEIAIVEAL